MPDPTLEPEPDPSGPTPDPGRGQDAAAGLQSALLLLVPAAEPAVGEYRARLDASARDGVPAHLTVLYPFLPPTLIDDAALTSLAALFAGFPAFTFTLDRVGWFAENVVWLGPRDEAPFRALTALAFEAFPSCAPYGGRHDDVVPHLTIGHQGGVPALRAAGDAVRPHLPIEAAATEVTLMAGPDPDTPGSPPRQWRRLAGFPLASPSPASSVTGAAHKTPQVTEPGPISAKQESALLPGLFVRGG